MEVDLFLRDLTIVVGLGAVLAWCSHTLRQPIILGYILSGVVAGPGGLHLIEDVNFVDAIGRIGVTLLLFLAGITLPPHSLVQLFRQSALVTLGTSAGAFAAAALFAWVWGFSVSQSALIGLALMYSSTILVIKLLPTTTLHQRHMGAICIAILIAQDLMAVILLLFITPEAPITGFALLALPVKGALLVVAAFIVEQYLLRPMMAKSDRIHEMLQLLSLAWCLGLAKLAHVVGLSYEVGAFIAGIALARSPLSLFLSEGLKPFRDFFLVLFFFVLGAKLDLIMVPKLLVPAVLLGVLVLVLKPAMFYVLFRWTGEPKKFCREASLRLGQASEFSLVIATYAADAGRMSQQAAQLVQLTAIITMVASAYIVVLKCPTPVSSNKKLQRD